MTVLVQRESTDTSAVPSADVKMAACAIRSPDSASANRVGLDPYVPTGVRLASGAGTARILVTATTGLRVTMSQGFANVNRDSLATG